MCVHELKCGYKSPPIVLQFGLYCLIVWIVFLDMIDTIAEAIVIDMIAATNILIDTIDTTHALLDTPLSMLSLKRGGGKESRGSKGRNTVNIAKYLFPDVVIQVWIQELSPLIVFNLYQQVHCVNLNQNITRTKV
jgi:hypothetical protein